VSAPVLLGVMTFCFLFFGYLGVPVPFSLMAGVFVGAMLADVSLAAIIQKIFDGVDSEALLAIPFFLLVGELMSSANVVVRIANLSLSLVGISGAGCRRSSSCSACSSRKCRARPPPTSP
jgi:C4-dicarboxylate transporter DctM subunit